MPRRSRASGHQDAAAWTAFRKRSTQPAISSGRVLKAARLTISREVTSAMCSISRSPFAFSVEPDETRSTMRRHRPSVGCQLHRAVQLDALGLHPAGGEVAAGRRSDIWWRRGYGSSAADRRSRPGPPARPPPGGRRRCRGRAARRARDSRTPSARRSPATPSCAAPKATKVATSNDRTRISRICGWLVAKDRPRCRGSSKAGSGSSPACVISGRSSSRMRPLGRAMVKGSGTVMAPASAGTAGTIAESAAARPEEAATRPCAKVKAAALPCPTRQHSRRRGRSGPWPRPAPAAGGPRSRKLSA